jgi:serine/threonine-protein kinase
MGEVYRARDTRLSRDVAIKVLPAAYAQDPDRLRRFRQEAIAASALNHPNILTVHDVGEVDGSPYVVSELLEGETLRQRLAAGALPARKAVAIATQIAEGLAAAHEKGIVHRDLKPENLFVTTDERVKILDFGLAKLRRPEEGAEPGSGAKTVTAGTESGVVLGTLGYMSPEQVRGQPADPRSDIFALGATLYEMLTGRRAFQGASAADTMSAILREEPGPLPSAPDSSPVLAQIVRRCLEKSPVERFQSARDLRFALQESVREPDASPRPPPQSLSVRSILWAAGATLLLVGMWLVRSCSPAPRMELDSAVTVRSLAVLPLENLSNDPEQEYFADGMTEALLTDVARLGAIRVVSRTSAMRYKGTGKTLPEIARELGVDAVVEGSVLHSGDRVRISAQLIHAATDRHLWAESYERDAEDVLTLQREIAREIADAIRLQLTDETQARLRAPAAVNPEAHREYLQGRFQWYKRTPEGFGRAIRHFERALEIDPSFALAYAGLGDCYVLLPADGIGLAAPHDALPKAHAAATRALQIDEGLAEAHATLAYERFYAWDWEAAEREFRRALELNPSYSVAHFWYAVSLAARGRHEDAAREAREAQVLDPVAAIITAGVSWMDHLSRDFEGAVAEAHKALELEPDFPIAHHRLGLALAELGRYEEAIRALEAAARSRRTPGAVAALGHVSALSGDAAAARAALAELERAARTEYVSAYHFALIHIGLGQKAEALRFLEEAYEEGAWTVTFANVEPALDPLRHESRFRELVRRLGLPDATR